MSGHNKTARYKLKTGLIMMMALGGVGILSSCASSDRVYISTLRNYPTCATESGIGAAKLDACLDNSTKADVNSCLLDKKVPLAKIDRLNACVDAHRRSTIGNLF